MEILRILLLFIFALIPFGQIVRVSVYPGVSIAPLDIIVAIFTISLAMYSIVHKVKIRFELYHIFFLAFYIVGTVSLLFHYQDLTSNQFLSSLVYGIRFLFYILPLFFMPLILQKHNKSMIPELSIVGFIFVLFGILQYIFLPRLELLAFLGEWDIHSYRLFSTFFDPNYAGLFIIFEILLLLMSISIYPKTSKIFLGMIVISYIALFLTFSRSSIVTVGVSMIFYLLLIGKKKLVGFFLGFLLLSIGLLFLYSKNFSGEGVKILRTVSIQMRLSSYQEGLKVFSGSPIFGVGFNSYKYAKNNYTELTRAEAVSNASNAPSNSFIFILATTGMLGFLCFGFFIVMLLKILFLKYKESKDKRIYSGAMAIILALLINSLFQNSLFYSPIVLVFALVIGGVFSYSRE